MSKPSTNKEVRVDAEFYGVVQQQFLERLVVSIMDQLKLVEVTPDQLDQATKGISFAVANIIDGTSQISVGEKTVRSVLTFAEDPYGNKLVAPKDFSGLHSYTYKLSEKILERDKAEKEKEEDA